MYFGIKKHVKANGAARALVEPYAYAGTRRGSRLRAGYANYWVVFSLLGHIYQSDPLERPSRLMSRRSTASRGMLNGSRRILDDHTYGKEIVLYASQIKQYKSSDWR